jgi:cobalt-zinc-cadmium efflux system membrane fusion protein
MARRAAIGLLASLALIGCFSAAEARTVTLSATQVAQMEIKLAEVKEAETEAVALLPGTVVPALNARVVAAASFAGTAIQVLVLPGQRWRRERRSRSLKAGTCSMH